MPRPNGRRKTFIPCNEDPYGPDNKGFKINRT